MNLAKLTMKRIEIVALLEDRKKLIERLQRRGIIELLNEQNDALVKINTAENVSQFEKGISTAAQAKSILNEYAPSKKSLLEAFSDRRDIDKTEFGKHVEKRNLYLKNCYELLSYQKMIIENRAAIVRTQMMADALKIWLGLDVPMQFKGTKNTRCFIGIVPKQMTSEDILCEIANINPSIEMIDAEVISSYKEQTCIMVLCHKDIVERTFDALREIGFTQPSDPTKHEPKVRMKRLENDLEKYNREIEENINKIKTYANSMTEIEFLIDYLTMRRDKYLALNKLGHTKNTFIITGYIPEKYVDKCVDELEKRFSVAINVTTPMEDEDVPVLLENDGFSEPLESITEMYALPAKRDVDPSPIMAFFYYMFFGMMLSDAGYGVVMVVLSAVLLKKFKLKDSMKKTFKMFFFCGISTVFWGALFGSWFGDIVQVVGREFFNKEISGLAIWFDPIKDPMTLLLLAFVLGIIHLFVGLGVNFKILWCEGRKKDAVLDVIPVYLMVLGAAPLGGSVLTTIPTVISSVGTYMALTGVVLIVLTSSRSSKNIFARLGGGLYGLYNIASGYLSDILSYSRLLALGLATGSIAGVVNLMGTMVDNAVLKPILLIIVFLVGHPVNIAINLLGAYVHTNRLQFVEFFSKFYEGGGRVFSPLKVNSQYIKFQEDIHNG